MTRIGARRSGGIGGARVLLVVSLSTLALSGTPVRAAETADAEASPDRLGDPAAPQALGRVFSAGPTAPALVLASSGGYGYTESVLHAGDAHHRAAGGLAVEGRPLAWLGLGLRLDGRYDRHDSSAQGSDDGWVGDPRLYLRVDRMLGAGFRAGGRLGLWLPGGAAPSITFAAATPELTAAMTWAARDSSLWLTANGGYRLNRSARSATDAALFSASDRLGLELSAFDQVLAGLAATYGGGRAQVFAELTAELLVGAGSPSPSASPLRAGGGVRLAINRAVRFEAQAEAALGSRPDLSASGPLVPVPPRAAVWLAVAYRFGATTPPRAPPRPAVVAAPAPVTVVLEGRVVSADGATPAEPRVTVQVNDAKEAAPVDVAADGRFTVSAKAGQTLTIAAEAAGYEPATDTVKLAAGGAAEVTLTLSRRLPSGQIRGLIRSFRGVSLSAEIEIVPVDDARAPQKGATPAESPPAPRTLQTQDGRFEADVAPGTYEVTITAPGYETQRRRVDVEQNGVTLLNADLRSAR